ncbi:MAG: radical SAM protein [Ruminococcus flavefaciens]|nr:radical SAM protein [Ruminococcus flavefaciens]
MPNIALTTKCNLKCPYCFADEYTGKKTWEEISFDNFLKAKKFILDSGLKGFGIIGGEPSLHGQYRKILRNCINDPHIERIVVYTNGLNIQNYIGEYSSSKVHFLINCNSPAILGGRFEKLQENINLLANDFCARNRITLGLNLYEEEQDYKYIIEMCKSINAHSVRLSVTVPMQPVDMRQYFNTMKHVLMSCYRDLCKENIRPHYDCNVLPSCLYTEKELFELATLLNNCGEERSRLIGEKCTCKPVIDILPDLTAIRCFGLSEACKVNITSFHNITDLQNYFLREIDGRLVEIENYAECDDCYKRKTLQCYGGCLAFRYNKMEEK